MKDKEHTEGTRNNFHWSIASPVDIFSAAPLDVSGRLDLSNIQEMLWK